MGPRHTAQCENPLSLCQKKKAVTPTGVTAFLAERKGFEPLIPFWGIHDFQSCALDQLGHLSTDLFIIADSISFVKRFFYNFLRFLFSDKTMFIIGVYNMYIETYLLTGSDLYDILCVEIVY